jgi:uncharacterized OB-fold protein
LTVNRFYEEARLDDGALLKPTLYQTEGTASAPRRPALLGGVCAGGHVFFPLQPYGCERCGNVDLRPLALSGFGKLLASARVHLHAGKGREAPFTVGAIQLDDGPIVRSLIVADAPVPAGTRMATTLVPVADAEGRTRLDLRFEPQATAP